MPKAKMAVHCPKDRFPIQGDLVEIVVLNTSVRASDTNCYGRIVPPGRHLRIEARQYWF